MVLLMCAPIHQESAPTDEPWISWLLSTPCKHGIPHASRRTPLQMWSALPLNVYAGAIPEESMSLLRVELASSVPPLGVVPFKSPPSFPRRSRQLVLLALFEGDRFGRFFRFTAAKNDAARLLTSARLMQVVCSAHCRRTFPCGLTSLPGPIAGLPRLRALGFHPVALATRAR